MHANLLTVEAALEETFRVRSARLKEFGSTGIIPHAISEARPLVLYPTQSFPHTGTPYPQHAAFRGSQALRRHRRIIPQASIMAPWLTKLIGRRHAPNCAVSSCTQEARCEGLDAVEKKN